MGFNNGSGGSAISTLTVDRDLDLGAFKLKTNHVAESTASHGVVIDNHLGLTDPNVGSITTNVLSVQAFLGVAPVAISASGTNIKQVSATLRSQIPATYANPAGYTTTVPLWVTAASVIRMSYHAWMDGASGYLRVYVNGTPAGTEKTINGTPSDYTDDLTVNPGDVITVYIKGDGSQPTFVNEMKVLGTVAADALPTTYPTHTW